MSKINLISNWACPAEHIGIGGICPITNFYRKGATFYMLIVANSKDQFTILRKYKSSVPSFSLNLTSNYQGLMTLLGFDQNLEL